MALEKFLKSVEPRDVITFVLFTATWCRRCQPIKEAFAKSAESNHDALIQFILLDVDDDGEVVEYCSVNVLPTIQIWSQRSLLDEKVCDSIEVYDKTIRRFHAERLRCASDEMTCSEDF